MKRSLLIIVILLACVTGFTQDVEMERSSDRGESSGGFKKENLFTGGGIQLSFSNYNFVAGASPILGYSFNKWFDAGIGFNYTYISAREAYLDAYGDAYATGNKIHQTDIAPIVFARAYPLKFLFVQAQAEHNFVSQKYIYAAGLPSDRAKYDVTSLLLGAGYCSGRESTGDFFYYLSISIDVLKDRQSPYVQQYANGSVSILPILRAGIQVPLFQGRKN